MASSYVDAAPGGGAFLSAKPKSIFTPEDFDSDSLLMIDTAKQFMRGEVMPILDRLDKQEDGLMPALLKKAGALGLAGPETPEEYGGLGISKCVGTRILEMLSWNGSFSTTMAVHMGIGQAPIYLWGTEKQKQRYLPRLASGEWMGAYALSEPNSGSDALGMSSKAVRDGDDYVLNGTKMWISNAKWADLFITFAKVDGEKVTCFIVERNFPGVTIGPEEHKTGLKGSSTARLVLDDARVPASNVLYREGEGHYVAFNSLNLGRLKLGAMSLGPARSALFHSAKYAKERKQFGKNIAEFGLIRDKFARMGALIYASESVLYRTCDLVDSAFAAIDKNSPDDNRKAAEAYAIECSANKILATEMLSYCADEAIQIHGGYGFTEEFPVARIWRDGRVTRIYEGTNEINRLFIFDRIIKRGLLDSLVCATPESFAHELLMSAAKCASAKLGSELSKNQEVTAALSDLVITHFAQQSAMARARNTSSSFSAAGASMYVSISDAFAASRASEIYSRCGQGKAISLPASDYSGAEIVAAAILEANGYPIG